MASLFSLLFVLFCIVIAIFHFTKSSDIILDVAPTRPIPTELPVLQHEPVKVKKLACIPPAIEEFPADLFTAEQRRNGAVLFHFLITAYLCCILAIVCDERFIPSLELISEWLNIPPDVAGATFMAVGTSSPELFSSVIGSFVTEGDIGVGTIVGSAVFNILGVTCVAGLAVWNKNVDIDWYPVTRDCIVYALSVIALILTIKDGAVEWWEARFLLMMFGGYVIIMYFNSDLEKFAKDTLASWKKSLNLNSEKSKHLANNNTETKIVKSNGFVDSTLPEEMELRKRVNSKAAADIISKNHENSSSKDEEAEEIWWHFPNGSKTEKIFWVLMFPARLLISLTVPDCRKKEKRHLFVLTFLMSIAWIGTLSYFCSWMVTIIGDTLQIPDTISGLTIMAAGISVPEVIASVVVMKNMPLLANMAMCNLIGSNIFDIMVCLSVPWLIKTLMFSTTGYVNINSGALPYTSITLLSTVLLLFLTLCAGRWRLNKDVGFMCLFLYIGFLIIACLYEMNYFGDFSPPSCRV